MRCILQCFATDSAAHRRWRIGDEHATRTKHSFEVSVSEDPLRLQITLRKGDSAEAKKDADDGDEAMAESADFAVPALTAQAPIDALNEYGSLFDVNAYLRDKRSAELHSVSAHIDERRRQRRQTMLRWQTMRHGELVAHFERSARHAPTHNHCRRA